MAPDPTGKEPDEVNFVSEDESTEDLTKDLVGFLGSSSYLDSRFQGLMDHHPEILLHLSFPQLLAIPLRTTFCLPPVSQASIQLATSPVIPSALHLDMSLTWATLSKALAKSR